MIKRFISVFVIESVALYLVSQIASGLMFTRGIQSLIVTGVALALASFFVKPIINILLLPINLVTFGVFKWVSHAVTLYIVDLLLAEFAVNSFKFAGLSSKYIDMPPINLPSGIPSYLAFSLTIAAITSIIYWLLDRK